jgi:hypothetical protein
MRAALVLALAACGTHVQLQAPASNITPAERVAMFKALERADQQTVAVSYNNGPWHLHSSTLILANGTHVELPEDLLPVVPPDSETARTARASAATKHRAEVLEAIAYGAAIVGTALILTSADNDQLGVSEDTMFYATAFAAGIPYLVSQYEHREAIALRMQAFSTYTRDLGLRLDVCAHALEVVACETAPSAYPPPPSYAPAQSYPPASKYPPPPGPVQNAPAPSAPTPAPSESPPAPPS